MSGKPKHTSEPHDRLTRLCGAMTDALDTHPERGDEKCVVFLQDGKQGGLQMHGYDDPAEAVADVLIHVRAILRSIGKDMQIHTLGQG